MSSRRLFSSSRVLRASGASNWPAYPPMRSAAQPTALTVIKTPRRGYATRGSDSAWRHYNAHFAKFEGMEKQLLVSMRQTLPWAAQTHYQNTAQGQQQVGLAVHYGGCLPCQRDEQQQVLCLAQERVAFARHCWQNLRVARRWSLQLL